MPTHPLHAWVDESVQVRHGLYLLAAAIAPVDPDVLDTCRGALRALTRSERLHWRDQKPATRLEVARTIGALPITNLVVTATDLDPKRQERARRKCLEQLLHRLSADNVEHVWLESRNHGDSADLQLVNALRARHSIGSGLVVDHALPRGEPMLWVPDAVAGAVAASHGDEPRFRDAIAHMLEEHRFSL